LFELGKQEIDLFNNVKKMRKISDQENWIGVGVGGRRDVDHPDEERAGRISDNAQFTYNHLARFDTRSTPNSTNSNKSLVHSLNSNTEYSAQPSRMPLSEEDRKAWSLTERVKGANGTDTNEYQGLGWRILHYILFILGAALVLFVSGLITAQTVQALFFQPLNGTNSTR